MAESQIRSFQEAPQMGLDQMVQMFQQQRGAQAQSSNPYQQMQDARYQQARSQPTVYMPGQLLQNYMQQQAYTPMQRPAPATVAQEIQAILSGDSGGGSDSGAAADSGATADGGVAPGTEGTTTAPDGTTTADSGTTGVAPGTEGTTTAPDGTTTADGGATADSGGGDGGGGGGGGGKIICTAMNNLYGLPYAENRVWLKYSVTHMRPEHQVGYHKVFLPLVDYAFKQGNGFTHLWLRGVLVWIGKNRTKDIQDELAGLNPRQIKRLFIRKPAEAALYHIGKWFGKNRGGK